MQNTQFMVYIHKFGILCTRIKQLEGVAIFFKKIVFKQNYKFEAMKKLKICFNFYTQGLRIKTSKIGKFSSRALKMKFFKG